MKSLISNLFLVFLCVVVGGNLVSSAPQEKKDEQKEFSLNIPTCSETSLNLNECLRSVFQEMLPRVKNGIKDLNIPPLDPFVVNKTTYQYTNGAVQGRISLKNVRIYGLSDAIVNKADLQLNDNRLRLELDTHVPHAIVEGNYKADMQINGLKMTPKGYFNITLTDVDIKSVPEGELYERDGHTYVRLNKIEMVPEVGDMHVYASGLFPDQAMTDMVLEFANQYWRQIYKEMLPATRTTWEPFVINFVNEFLATIPFDSVVTKN